MFKQILKSTQTEGNVFSYEPKAFGHPIPDQAIPFARSQDETSVNNEFKINELVAQNTGLSELEKKNFRARVEEQVLERMKVVQEKAYAEAHALGMDDGRNQAFADSKREINQALENLRSITTNIANVKKEMFVTNESQFMRIIFQIAKALALTEIQTTPEVIGPVLAKALENITSDEEITIRLNPRDAQFVERVKEEGGGPFERIPKVRVEVSESISQGGCVVETNYGVIDASIEKRVEKIWETIGSKIPKAGS